MCGIAGVLHPNSETALAVIPAMNNAQMHRGPDDGGMEFIKADGFSVGLAHRRLAIIDVSTAGHQPMNDSDTGNWITFNGEIYNFQELRRELEKKGQAFRTGTDTEVILKGYAVWGLECVRRLRGIFAFGIWDASSKRLLLARDQLGVKPLYYWRRNDAFLFASEVRALLATGLTGAKLDYDGLRSYLAYGSVQEPFTMVQGIRSLEAGHLMVWDKGLVSTKRYWELPRPEMASREVSKKLYEEAAHRLFDAVDSQLISDVPLGAFLSGGIDSTAIAALMQRSNKRTARTFSVVFNEEAYDERHWSQLAAREIGTEHTELTLTADKVCHDLPRALGCFDQPSIDGLNTYFISQAVREAGLTVALSGVGGDELFGGYDGFRKPLRIDRFHSATHQFPLFIRRMLSGALNACGLWETIRKAADTLVTTRDPYLLSRRLFSDRQLSRLLSGDIVFPDSWEEKAFGRLETESRLYDPINRISALEMQTYMLSTLLRDTDQMSMAHALEVRVPLIDPLLVEFCFTVPGSCKIENGQPKPLLTRPLGDLLPRACVHRPKRGFVLPFQLWLSGALKSEMQDSLAGVAARESTLFEPGALAALWAQYQSGRVNWSRVWAIFVLIRWMQQNRIEAE
jgi:asparagine synthase (glutamine-hydrolysing)